MTRSVLVVGHADADGHLIAEQSRRNLDLIEAFKVNVVVDPARTEGHRAWMRLDAIKEIEKADIVCFVDLMFSPATFVEEAAALMEFVRERPDKDFFVIDHHPLPLHRLSSAPNLRMHYRPDVFECTIGPRSGMMVVAAICENQATAVADIKEPLHSTLAMGMRRAAAHGGPLPGEKLLALLRSDKWDALMQIGEEEKELHRLPRGRRPRNQTPSAALKSAASEAERLLASRSRPRRDQSAAPTKGVEMSYDMDIALERFPAESGVRSRANYPPPSKDLEAIVTLLELAALSLTIVVGSTFSVEQLLREARRLAGPDFDLNDRDVKIVLEKQGFAIKVGAEYRLK